MDKKLLKKYQQIDAKLKAMESEKKALREEIVEGLKKEKVEKVKTEFGSFTIASRLSYIYSPKVKELEEKVKLAKIKEEQKGIAEEKKTEYLVYSNRKDEE